MFNVGTNTLCRDIVIFDDVIFEHDESFAVSLTSSTDGIIIDTSSSTIDIRSDDGKFYLVESSAAWYNLCFFPPNIFSFFKQ